MTDAGPARFAGRRFLIAGASRGIGGAAARHFAAQGAEVLAVSRGEPAAGTWVRADLSTGEGLEAVVQAAGGAPLDALLYLGGLWEAGAFTDAYGFAESSLDEARAVLAVNLLAPLELARRLAPALRRADDPRIVLMGSLSGLPGRAGREVANTASKFGLQGLAEALRLSLPGLGVTVVNPGNVATPEVEDDIREGRFGPQVPIPMADLLAVLDLVLTLSPATEVETVNLGQRRPG